MAVYQTISKTQLHVGYDRYNLEEGQLIAINDKKVVGFFKNHQGFREVYDDNLIKMAPPLHLIRDPQDPYRMRKEDVIRELRSYGIAVDPYDFCDKLTMQLQIARKMLKRNFVTVLNDDGIPVFVDTIKIQPAINSIDESISEPEEPKGDFYGADEEDEALDDIVKHPYRAKTEENVSKKMPKNIAMEVEPVYDENEINDGKDYAEFLRDVAEKEYRASVEKEMGVKDLLDPKKAPPTPEELDPELVTIETSAIKPENYKHLVQMDLTKHFIVNELTDEEKEQLKIMRWPYVNINVFDNVMRNHNIQGDESVKGQERRWHVVEVIKEKLLPLQKNETNFFVEVNMLQRRYDEICKLEPSYRNHSIRTVKKRLSELSRYGVNTWYNKNDNVKFLCRKMYALAKMGLQIPETEEEIDVLLRANNRESAIKESKSK